MEKQCETFDRITHYFKEAKKALEPLNGKERLIVIADLLAETACAYGANWTEVKYAIALCCKSTLDAVDKAQQVFGDDVFSKAKSEADSICDKVEQ
jgi:hypothetical protein